ncbi:MAG TPA: O-methyltransferase [Tepidisphaeraceae bacterium]|jgi:predicted O-methyltransferase YrrM
MDQDQWRAVDQYITDIIVKPDAALDAALRACEAAGLPSISVSPSQGKLLMLLAMIRGAKNILEIGTLGGYSTIWLARGLSPGGKVITLEAESRHAEVARKNIDTARLSHAVDIRIGRAIDTLPRLAEQKVGPFDLIFIDADKSSLPDYFQWSMKLSKPGTLIVIDNVIRKGAVLDTSGADPPVVGVRRMNELIAAEPRACATTLQTVGAKGYDGLTFVVVL